jgi:hypothetical protein
VTKLAAAQPLHELLETDWDAQLFRGPKALATMLGWTSYHTLRSKGSKTGYPDRTLVRDRIIFAELKREAEVGKRGQPLKLSHDVTDDQRDWLDKLARAGGEVYVWKPSDLEEIARILSGRWDYSWGADPGLSTHIGNAWTPNSLWIPGLGRSDTTEQQSLLTTKGAAA